jgi:hypothetical protein
MNSFRILLAASTALLTANFALAQTWTQTSAPNSSWSAVASSADGTKLLAVAFGKSPSRIYISTNSGVSWTTNGAPNEMWGAIASSADGNTLVASVAFYLRTNVIYVSTNAGATWTSNTNVPSLGFFACSADGRKWIASAGSGGIYTSTNSGATWTSNNVPNGFWLCVASSADGTKLVAAEATNLATYISHIYVSRDSGNTWILTSAPGLTWDSISTSADGKKLVASAALTAYTSPAIYRSTDSGTSWVPASVPGNTWSSVASSADGNKLVAAARYEPLYVSTNAGEIWSLADSPSVGWQGVASSADGNKLVAIDESGGIWTSQTTPAPQMNITPTYGNFTLSWLVPSTNFVMQQSSDLGSWTDMTNQPVLNLTNLQNEVMLSPSSSSGFYRLKTP